MKSLSFAHGPVWYRQAGTGAPLLLLHGWGGSSRYWQRTLDALSDVRQTYAPDLPGHGQSPPLRESSSSMHLAALMVAFADHLNLETFDLVAHSFGASVAICLAAHFPHRVRRLVLTSFSTFHSESERRMTEYMLVQMGASVNMWQPWMALWHPWMDLWQAWMIGWMSGWVPGAEAYMPSVYQPLAWRFFYQTPNDHTLLREGFEDFLRMDRRTSLDNILSALSPSITPAMQAIQAPTLLVAARQDMIMPPSGASVVQQLIPDCRTVWFEHCGHMPMIEKAEEYHPLVRSFLLDEMGEMGDR